MNLGPEHLAEGQVLLVNKPLQWTSFDVIKKLRWLLKVKKIGHAGTLDPLATGLLIICTGKMTKQIEQFQGQEKEYTGQFILGKTTPSIDLETEFDSESPWEHISESEILKARDTFVGEITQLPPIHSAVKIDGKRAFKYARAGQEVKVRPRFVEVKEFELTDISLPAISFRIVCSKGTYIRSIVKDFGEVLGCGAYLAVLRRTRIGDHRVSDAWEIEDYIRWKEEQ